MPEAWSCSCLFLNPCWNTRWRVLECCLLLLHTELLMHLLHITLCYHSARANWNVCPHPALLISKMYLCRACLKPSFMSKAGNNSPLHAAQKLKWNLQPSFQGLWLLIFLPLLPPPPPASCCLLSLSSKQVLSSFGLNITNPEFLFPGAKALSWTLGGDYESVVATLDKCLLIAHTKTNSS